MVILTIVILTKARGGDDADELRVISLARRGRYTGVVIVSSEHSCDSRQIYLILCALPHTLCLYSPRLGLSEVQQLLGLRLHAVLTTYCAFDTYHAVLHRAVYSLCCHRQPTVGARGEAQAYTCYGYILVLTSWCKRRSPRALAHLPRSIWSISQAHSK